jgi:hypothetical protein
MTLESSADLEWWSQNPYQAFEHDTGLPKSKFSLQNFMSQKLHPFSFVQKNKALGTYIWAC